MTPQSRCLIGTLVAMLALLGSAARPAPESWATRAYDWPLAPVPDVVRGFDPPAQRWLPGHRGVDLRATAQSAVLAARSGTVHFAGAVAGRSVVSVRHADGILTTYEPVRPIVPEGDHVAAGQVIGTLEPGHPGCTAQACLHWGARRGSGSSARYLNPLGLLGALRVRLKPLTPADAPGRAPPADAPR
ncbi:M23 family metallopeptidase [Gordonia zhaorongruii]|uniref:M23 family metallopeptidase n=1 Tax=Gordonia zhaorongruii TaxID=2597659 RepID=UPI00117CC8EA|nr:M23 family metallopeptidase [Gordonia zhaorongruii]